MLHQIVINTLEVVKYRSEQQYSVWYCYLCFPDLTEVKSLLQEAEQKKFPESELLQALMQVVTEAEKCASVAQQLACKKVRTR
jgi:hypothetical protein